MSIIIPYNKSLENSTGAFIDPSGEIMSIISNHDDFANNYCNGQYYDYLIKLKQNYIDFCYLINCIHNIPNFLDDDLRVNEYFSSKLNREQLELYRLWLKYYKYSKNNVLSDFLVRFLHFDKVEKVIPKCISTTSYQPHVRFYNYYLMDWNINQITPLKFNYNKNEFENDYQSEYLFVKKQDDKAEEEIKQIKKLVLVKDRPVFFK